MLLENHTKMYIKRRYILLLLAYFGLFTLALLRNSLSITIVAMVNRTSDATENVSNSKNSCPYNGNETNKTLQNIQAGKFNWSLVQQGIILGCYSYGYFLTNIPGTYLSHLVGPKKVISVSMFFGAILTLLSPITAKTSFELFVALRALLGFFQGAGYSTMIGIWNSWAPPLERTILISITLAGNSFGSVVVLPLAGLIAAKLGWESVFYITGGWAILWTLCWVLLMYDAPDKHPRISVKEKNFICSSVGNTAQIERLNPPWCSMLTSIPMWAIVIAHFSSNWADYTVITLLPTYLSTVLHFDITSSGILSALPYILQWLTIMLTGYITDVIRKRKLTSTIKIRKINSTIGLVVPAICIVLAGYVGCNAVAAVFFFCLSFLFSGFVAPGFKSNTSDIAPRFGGITFALSNTFANIPGFLAPYVGGVILSKDSGLPQWQTIFWISFGIYTFGAIIYLIFGSAKEQHWAKPDQKKTELELPLQENISQKADRF